MRPSHRLVVVSLVAIVALAAAPAGTLVEGNHVRVHMPAGWKQLSAITEGWKKLLNKPGISGDAVGWGDDRAGVNGVMVWIDMAGQGDGPVRGIQDAFLRGLVKAMPRAGENQRLEETKTRLVRRSSSETADSAITMMATSAIEKNNDLHGLVVMCLRTGDAKARAKTAAACDAFMKSVEVTWKDAELKPLEKK
jgi:hypothetical protein